MERLEAEDAALEDTLETEAQWLAAAQVPPLPAPSLPWPPDIPHCGPGRSVRRLKLETRDKLLLPG